MQVNTCIVCVRACTCIHVRAYNYNYVLCVFALIITDDVNIFYQRTSSFLARQSLINETVINNFAFMDSDSVTASLECIPASPTDQPYWEVDVFNGNISAFIAQRVSGVFTVDSLTVTVSYAMPNAITLDIEGFDRQDDTNGQYRCVSAEMAGAFIVITLTRGERQQATNMYLLSKK